MTAPPRESVPATGPDGPSQQLLLLVCSVPFRVIAAGVSGGVLFLSFPPRNLWWLAPLAFAGLGLVLHGARMRGGFGYGLVFGLAFNLPHLLWIQDFLGAEFGPWPWLGLSLIMALFAAAAGAGMALVGTLTGGPIWMAMLYLVQEWLRSVWPINGFPWGRVAFGQPDGVYASLASLGGAPLVGFAVLVTGLCLARLLVRLGAACGWILQVEGGDAQDAPGQRLSLISVPALGVVLPALVALLLWPTIGTAPSAGSAGVGVVQGNAPDAGLDLMGDRETIRENHIAESERLSERIAEGGQPPPDLVVWPETATSFSGDDLVLDNLVNRFDAPALIGVMYGGAADHIENAVVEWDPDTGAGERYVKQELVPFSEYVPLRTIAGWFTPFVERTVDMREGNSPGVLDVGGTTAGVAICYEVAYDYVLREAVAEGAQMLAVPTNNAWFGRSEMSHQQLAMSQLRAIEHSRAVVVSATSGVSAIVAPDGSVQRSTELFTAESFVETIPLRADTTVATRLGEWPQRVLGGLGLAALLVAVSERVRGHSRRRWLTLRDERDQR